MSRTLRWSVAKLALIGLVAGSAACVPATTLPSDCGATTVERAATLTTGGLNPSATDVCKGQKVTFTIDVERAGVLHMHGYDDQVPEQEVKVGDHPKLTFTASRAGQFIIELHLGSDEVQIGILTVHEH